MEIEGSNEDGRVKIWLSGNQQPLRVELEKSILKEEHEIVEEATLEALKEAYNNSTETMKNKMEEITGGLNFNIPGLNDGN